MFSHLSTADSFFNVYKNYPLVCSAVSWLIAQILKVIINLIVHKELSPKLIWSSGGMPSSHSSAVVSLSLAIGLTQGFLSPLFAISSIFAFIVMYDAAGVRRETGDIAKVLNNLVINNPEVENSEEYKELKELVGHTPIEVVGGAALGIAIPLLIKPF
ncbi:MAG: divergent PAP2 family protein [Clostridiales bacterium]|nr:divergent PAP2 family protein [Clostridiales bacterium]